MKTTSTSSSEAKEAMRRLQELPPLPERYRVWQANSVAELETLTDARPGEVAYVSKTGWYCLARTGWHRERSPRPSGETMSDFDCQSCGACCRANHPREKSYVMLDGRDVRRLSRYYRRLNVVNHRSSKFLRTKQTDDGNTCVALGGTVGESVRCLIYDKRPELCRLFNPGSRECRQARKEAGI